MEKTYCQAARATWQLIKSNGFDAIINDSLIGPTLGLGSLIGGIITGLTAGGVAYAIVKDYWILLAIFGFFIGFVMVQTLTEVINSGVATTFVCFAQEPQVLQRNNPHLYQKFVDTYNNILHWV